ncbi:type II toxin-antitoxin system RelE/ParE family toxin [Flavobacterium album]|uniref:Type II toxin-antitoxin system RelE/ParE family toxin n=1 Tax=Flavobacterium album TaxID=2175091 RepID=A0A2S1QWE4_9FLAO|nr:type II toxin-antitoxin system RelE/ParE family toxin [Flavobacterium album]
MGKKVVWTRVAIEQLSDIHEYIYNTTKSFRIADNVILQIQNSSEILSNNPEIYPLDIYKLRNNGNYRAYEIFHYRISYRIEEQIYITSLRHTSRVPKLY